MRVRSTSLLLLLVSLLAAALLAAGCGADSEAAPDDDTRDAATTSTEHDNMDDDAHASMDEMDDGATEFELEVEGGVVKGGPQQLRAKRGDTIVIRIESDTADEVHLHGIDIHTDVAPGKPGTLRFTAKDQGSYELEGHETGLVLGAVIVS